MYVNKNICIVKAEDGKSEQKKEKEKSLAKARLLLYNQIKRGN